MKVYINLVIFIGFFIVASSPSANGSEKYHQLFATSKNGQSISYQVLREKIKSLPKWEGIGNPPLAIEDVVNIALEKTKKEANVDIASIKSIGLRSRISGCIDSDCEIDIWYYKVETKSAARLERVSKGNKYSYVILMDGSFAEKEVQDFKFR